MVFAAKQPTTTSREDDLFLMLMSASAESTRLPCQKPNCTGIGGWSSTLRARMRQIGTAFTLVARTSRSCRAPLCCCMIPEQHALCAKQGVDVMDDGASLERLASLAGIESDYWDIWGNYHGVDAEAKRRILLALGLPAGDQTAITASIRRLEEQEWRRWLPPVVTAWEGEQPKLVLALPVERVAYPLTLEIIQESGAQSEFTVHPAETPIHDRKSLAEGEVVRYLVLLPQTLPNGYHVVRPAEKPDQASRPIVASTLLSPRVAGEEQELGYFRPALHAQAPG